IMTSATTSPATIYAVADRFIELCSQGKNFDVMHTLYAPDIVSVEADGQETAGKTPVIQKSERWQAVNTVHQETVHGPFFHGANGSGGQFAVHFVFEVTPKATGKPVSLEEVAVYTVTNGLISREQFYYAGTR